MNIGPLNLQVEKDLFLCCGRFIHAISGRFVSLKVSTVDGIIDCLNRNIVMDWDNVLLIDWVGRSGEWGILCLSHYKQIVLSVSRMGTSITWSLFHISLMCWLAQQPTGSALAAVEMIVLIQARTVPKGTMFHLSPSQRWAKVTTFGWTCQSRKYWPTQQSAMFWGQVLC